MTDYLHPGKTTTGHYYAKPTLKLFDVIKQLSVRSVTFSWQCTSAQVIGCSLRLCSQWLFPNKKSEVP